MGRAKIEIKKIECTRDRLATFSKRRAGLFKKAYELSVLCEVQLGIILFTSAGTLFEYCSSSMSALLDRYHKHDLEAHTLGVKRSAPSAGVDTSQVVPPPQPPRSVSTTEDKAIKQLRHELEMTRRAVAHYKGESLELLGATDLSRLETELETGLRKVRLRRTAHLQTEIGKLREQQAQVTVGLNQLQAGAGAVITGGLAGLPGVPAAADLAAMQPGVKLPAGAIGAEAVLGAGGAPTSQPPGGALDADSLGVHAVAAAVAAAAAAGSSDLPHAALANANLPLFLPGKALQPGFYVGAELGASQRAAAVGKYKKKRTKRLEQAAQTSGKPIKDAGPDPLGEAPALPLALPGMSAPGIPTTLPTTLPVSTLPVVSTVPDISAPLPGGADMLSQIASTGAAGLRAFGLTALTGSMAPVDPLAAGALAAALPAASVLPVAELQAPELAPAGVDQPAAMAVDATPGILSDL